MDDLVSHVTGCRAPLLPCLVPVRNGSPSPWLQTLSLLSPPAGPGAAGQNKQHSITKNTAKLDRETEELHHDRVTLEVGKVIQQGRQSKGLTQKDLATVSVVGPPFPRLWSGRRDRYSEGPVLCALPAW